jgi:hypothetical protein
MKWQRASLVFVVFLCLYLLTAGGHLYSPDEEIMFRVTEAIASRGSLAVEPIRDPSGRTFATRAGVGRTDGREYAQYGVLNSVLALPLYWAGAAVARLTSDEAAAAALDFKTTNYLPREGPGRGRDLVKRFAVSFTGCFVGAAIVALLWLLVHRAASQAVAHRDEPFVSEDRAARKVNRIAWLTALAYGAGTMAWPHARTFFSEPAATLFVLLAFYWAAGGSALSYGRAAGVGVSCALALAARLDSAVALPGVGLVLLLRFLEERHGSLRSAARASARSLLADLRRPRLALGAAAFVAPMAVFGLFTVVQNRLLYGAFFTSAYADQPEGIAFTTPLLAGLYGFLFSAGKSVFLFSPAVILGVVGFGLFARRCPALAIGLLAAVVFKVLFHCRWQNWAGGWCWGPRHFFMVHALVMLAAVGFLLRWTRVRRIAYAAVMLPAVVVQIYGSSQSFIDFYILYYRTPDALPQAYVLFAPDDTAPMLVRMQQMRPDGRWEALRPDRLPAPLNDSIYVPQNSQWYRYAEMARLGYTDNLWLRLIQRARGEERDIE